MLKLFLLLFFSLQISYNLLEPEDFERALRNNKEAVLLDLRNIESYEKGHIKNASVIDFLRDDFDEYFQKKYKKSTPLYIYGQSSRASEDAGLYISELGYTQVNALKGGFENWIKKSRPYKIANVFTKEPLRYISKENYQFMIRENKWVLIIFYGENCEECKEIEQTFTSLKTEVPEITLKKINFENNVEIAEDQKIVRSPTLILYKNGIQYWRKTGGVTKEELKKQLF